MRFLKRRSQKVGASPGSLQLVSETEPEKVEIHAIDYDADGVREKMAARAEECFEYRGTPSVSWINVDGLQVETVGALGKHFGVHPLVLEDILTTGQRPKFEEFDDFLFIVLRMLTCRDDLKDEQVSLIVTSGCVISFQEVTGDVFDPVRVRIGHGKGRIRKRNSDYLAYALADTIVDHYFTVLEKLGDEIEDLEERLVEQPEPEVLQQMYDLRRKLVLIRRSIWPLREVISTFQRTESSLIAEDTRMYLRDVYDHTIQVIDTLEAFRDVTSSMLDLYLSNVSHRMNEIMKFLTLIATIFIPLTFIAGIYGMNFEYMPELRWPWGYFLVLILMLVIGVGMALSFKRRKWL